MSDAVEPSVSQAARAPLVGIAVNASLAAVKILAGTFGNSYALIADGIESTSDIVTSLVVWGGLQVAARPADKQHPYGYGKAESLAGIVGAVALLAAAVTIAVQSVYEILTPHHLPHWSTLAVLAAVVCVKLALGRWVSHLGDELDSSALTLWIAVITLFAKEGLYRYTMLIANRFDSNMLRANAWHHRSDALTSLAAFIGISIGLVGGPGYEPADDYAALIACFVIAASGLRLLLIATKDVLDVAPSREFEHQLRALAAAVPGVKAIEKCRIRKSGLAYFVDIHVQVDGNATVREGHAIGGRVRAALRNSSYRIADALVHIEPHAGT
jgi:cation diffusion facilitator family transporter